jgi:hypothetical protein
MSAARERGAVIPAKAGFRLLDAREAAKWIPAFAGTNIG